MKSAVALMTCHKRNEKPLASIARYYVCDVPEGFTRQTVLVDDGGRDGIRTTVAISQA